MFPNILYDAKGNGQSTVMKDIFRRVKLKSTERVVGFDYYDVQDGETPEIIAHKYYGDVGLHWTILVANDISRLLPPVAMSMQTFEQYVTEKYTNPAAVHHYEIELQHLVTLQNVIDVGMNTTDYGSATAVSNYQYEQKPNDELAKIRLIQPSHQGFCKRV